MLFKAILLSLLCAPGLLLGQEAHIANFGGVDNFHDSMMIADTDAQSAVNVLTDEGDLRTIYGNTLYSVVGSSSIAFIKEWINPSGSRVLFVQSGYRLYATDPSSGAITSIKYFGADRDLDMVAAFNRAYFTDQTSSPFYSTGSSTTVSPGFEDCKYVETYQNRLVCVNMSTDTSKVKLSAYNSATDWTVTSSVDSGAVKYFKKDDGEGINCVFTTPDGLFIGKDSSVGILRGDDNADFTWYYLDNGVGCTDDRSVQYVDGELIWMSKDGFYSYDGGGALRPANLGIPKLRSAKISNSVKLIRRSNSADSVWTVNTAPTWQEGTGTGWDYSIVPGSIKAEAYNSGALTTGATRYIRMFEGAGFEGNNNTAWTPAFDLLGSDMICFGGGPPHGAYFAEIVQTVAYSTAPYISIINSADGVLISSAVLVNNSWNQYAVSGSGNIYLRLVDGLGTTRTSSSFDRSLGVNIFYKRINQCLVGQGGREYFDGIEVNPSITTAITSSTNTLLTSPEYSADFKGGNATLNFYASADNSTFISTTVALPGGAIPSDYWKRYYKYSITFSSGVSISSFTSLTLSVLSTSAYTSAVHFTADDMSAWKLFTVSDSGTATPIYSVRTATYAFAAAAISPAFITQPANATVVASTGPYVQFRVNPNIATSTDSLTVGSISLAYSVGQLSPRAASVVDDHRYIASVSHNSATENDITYIWQKNKEWTFSDQGYAALGIFNGQPLGGSTDSASKLWYIMDPLAYSFDGTAISSEWITKDYTFGAINNHKVINRLWITAGNNGMANLGIAWQANRDGVWNSTTTALNGSSFVIKEVDGLFESQYPGRQFRFRLNSSELSKYFRLKLFSVYYKVNALIRD